MLLNGIRKCKMNKKDKKFCERDGLEEKGSQVGNNWGGGGKEVSQKVTEEWRWGRRQVQKHLGGTRLCPEECKEIIAIQ